MLWADGKGEILSRKTSIMKKMNVTPDKSVCDITEFEGTLLAQLDATAMAVMYLAVACQAWVECSEVVTDEGRFLLN